GEEAARFEYQVANKAFVSVFVGLVRIGEPMPFKQALVDHPHEMPHLRDHAPRRAGVRDLRDATDPVELEPNQCLPLLRMTADRAAGLNDPECLDTHDVRSRSVFPDGCYHGLFHRSGSTRITDQVVPSRILVRQSRLRSLPYAYYNPSVTIHGVVP